MKKFNILVSILIGVVLTLVGFSEKEELRTLAIGEKAPLLTHKLKTTGGNNITLSSLKNKNGYLVIFSCNTCPFVVGGSSFEGWEKDYNDIYNWTLASEVGMVLVNSNEAKRKEGDSMKDMTTRAAEMGYKMPYALDKNHALADAFGAKTTPHVFLFNADDELIYEGSINNTWNPKMEQVDNLKNALVAVAKGSEIEINKTAPKGCSIKRVN